MLQVGQKPANVLLASMFVAMFASMWISNVAAPALCFSLLQPILRTLNTADATSKSLVMGEPPPPTHTHGWRYRRAPGPLPSISPFFLWKA